MKNTATKNKGIKKIIAAALAAMTVMTATVICVSASGSENTETKAAASVTRAADAKPAEVKEENKETLEVGTTFNIGEKIVLDDAYVVTDDIKGAEKAQSVKGEFKLDTEYIAFTMMKGQFEFIGLFGDKDLRITTFDAPSTSSLKTSVSRSVNSVLTAFPRLTTGVESG